MLSGSWKRPLSGDDLAKYNVMVCFFRKIQIHQCDFVRRGKGQDMNLLQAPIALLEVVDQWKIRIGDIIALVIRGELEVHYFYSGALQMFEDGPLSEKYHGWVRISGMDILSLQAKKPSNLKQVLPLEGHQLSYMHDSNAYSFIPKEDNVTVTVEELFVSISELANFERKYKDIIQNGGGQLFFNYNLELQNARKEEGVEMEMEESEGTKNDEKLNMYKVFDPDHPWHSRHLLLSIQAWVALYANRKGTPVESKPPGGHIKLIVKWLEENKPSESIISPTTLNTMAMVINPDKSKGPGKSKG